MSETWKSREEICQPLPFFCLTFLEKNYGGLFGKIWGIGMKSKKFAEMISVIFNTQSVLFKNAIILFFMSIMAITISLIGISRIHDMNLVANDIFFSNTSALYPLTDTLDILYVTEETATNAVLLGDSGAISGLAGDINNMNGQLGNFKSSLSEQSSAEIEKIWNDYQTAARDLFNELRNKGPAVPGLYHKFRNESQVLYRYLYGLNTKYRIRGLATYNRGKRIYESVILLQTWITVIGVAIGIFISVLVTISIIRPLQQLRKTTDLLAKGDLRARVKVSSNDEIGMVGAAFNRAVDELRGMVTDAAENAKNINTSANDLFKVTDATSRSLEDLNQLVENMTAGAATQTQAVENAIKTVQKATEGADLVSKATFEINHTCKEASVAAERGGEASGEMMESITNLVNRVNQIDHMVQDLARDSKQIQDLIDVINDIAEKTTLLSLNASIEAARAGGQGRGFMVVATNIRQLSTQARESVEHIRQVIDKILDKTYQVVATVEQGTIEVDRSHATLTETVALFKELVSRVDQITANISRIAVTASGMSADNAAVISEMAAVSQISQDNLTAVKEVSATFLEQYSSRMVVTEAARDLHSLAEQLSAAADKFRL
jgi:methyl-accepting chemotaxis protein